jgi:hypothetical protein
MYIKDGEIPNSITGRDAVALKAQRTVFDGINIPLPDDQWTIEVGGWFSIVLARLQLAVLEYSTGPADTDFGRYQRASSLDRIYDNTCGKQKVQQFNFSNNYSNINALGLVIVLAIGVTIILVSWVLEGIVGAIMRWTGRGRQRRKQWKRHGNFQAGNPLAGPRFIPPPQPSQGNAGPPQSAINSPAV